MLEINHLETNLPEKSNEGSASDRATSTTYPFAYAFDACMIGSKSRRETDIEQQASDLVQASVI